MKGGGGGRGLGGASLKRSDLVNLVIQIELKLQACAVEASRCSSKLLNLREIYLQMFLIYPHYTWSAANHLILFFFFLSSFLSSFHLLLLFFCSSLSTFLHPSCFQLYFYLHFSLFTSWLWHSTAAKFNRFNMYVFPFIGWWLPDSGVLMYLGMYVRNEQFLTLQVIPPKLIKLLIRIVNDPTQNIAHILLIWKKAF